MHLIRWIALDERDAADSRHVWYDIGKEGGYMKSFCGKRATVKRIRRGHASDLFPRCGDCQRAIAARIEDEMRDGDSALVLQLVNALEGV